MAFIRTKYIKGNPYAYLVENEWGKKGSRQTVNEYLGRIHQRPPTKQPVLPDNLRADDILPELIHAELQGLEADVDVDLQAGTVTRSGRDIVVSLNGGYLCSHTLQAIKKAKLARNEERPGLALAEAISRAGLRITQHHFVALYRSLR